MTEMFKHHMQTKKFLFLQEGKKKGGKQNSELFNKINKIFK